MTTKPPACPFCGAERFACGTLAVNGVLDRSATCRNREAVRECEKVCAANEPGAHALAVRLRAILTGEVRRYV